jgi:hypothetical protein
MESDSDAPRYATLSEACEWLETQGVRRVPRQLIEAGDAGRLTLCAGVPEGAHAFERNSRELKLRRFAKGELVELSRADCRQFLQTGEAHIYGAGLGPSDVERHLAQRGVTVTGTDPLGDLSTALIVRHDSALRVKGDELERYAGTESVIPIGLIAKDAAEREHLPVLGENDLRRDIRDALRANTEKDFLARLVEYLRQGRLRAVNPLNGAPYDPALPGLDPADPMWALDAAERERALELLGQLVRTDDAGFSSVVLQSTKANVADARAKQERQARELYTLAEAAQLVADANGLAARALLEDFRVEVRKGRLTTRKSDTLAPADRASAQSGFWVTPADLDALFEVWNVPYRFPQADDAGSSLGNSGPVKESKEQRRGRLQAQRDELKAKGIKDFARRTAAAEGIKPARLRQLLSEGKKSAKATAKKRSPFDV